MPTLPTKIRFTLLLAVTFNLAATSAFALSLEKLLMPGELTTAHAEFEDDCSACHADSKQADQTAICLGCHDHEDVATDIKNRTGFHGRSPRARGLPCKQCHSEHLGRSADIVLLALGSFDHSMTDYPLEGAHAKLRCDSCHLPDVEYRDAPKQCFDCHERDDHHRGNLGKECKDCHTENQWTEARFDHDTTDFPLRGEHRQVACELCHSDQRYENVDRSCISCHRTQDVHRGRNGDTCDNCHKPESWKKVTFDHSKTDFPLVGKHRKVSCRTCHRAKLYQEELDTECVACHRSDDQHKGRNGNECENCHSPKTWKKTAFNHDLDTKFALRGKHKQLTCESCHVEDAYKKKLKAECFACHRDDDVHEGQEGEQCATCHRETGWGEEVFFEHDLTAFPLIGMHATTTCEQCHVTAAYKNTDSECIECHAGDDFHEQTLGSGCDLCHNPNNWALWLFDHNTQTEFNIDGAHAELSCRSCHRSATDARIPELRGSCVSCHKADDVHRGSFGASCNRCHGTESFRGALVK